MRNLSDIERSLAESLSSQAWKSLKGSVVGKELIAFGARVILQADSLQSAIGSTFDYKTASERQLVILGRNLGVSPSFTRPSWVRVYIHDSVVAGPYCLRFQVGNFVFYNLEAFRGPGTCTLCMGVVCKTSQNEGAFQNEFFAGAQYFPWERSSEEEATNPPTVVDFINLGNVVPDSILSFLHSGLESSVLSQYSPFVGGPSIECFKLETALDKTCHFILADGSWGKVFQEDQLEIVWLKPKTDSFSVDGGKCFCYSVPDGEGTELNVEVVSYGKGVSDDITYAREVFTRELAKTSVVASYNQLKEYVKSFDSVLDCEISAINNLVVIYVKPVSEDSVFSSDTYGDIVSKLLMVGTLFTTYDVVVGSPVYFGLKISGVSEQYRSSVASALESKYAYSELGYAFQLNVAHVAAYVNGLCGENTRVFATLKVYGVSSPTILPSSVEPGSLSIVDSDDNQLAFDRDSQILGVDQNSISFGEVCPVGDWFFVCSNGHSIKYVGSLLGSVVGCSESVLFNSLGMTDSGASGCKFPFESNGYFFVSGKESAVTVTRVYNRSALSESGLVNGTVSPVYKFTGLDIGSFAGLSSEDYSKTITLYNGVLYAVNMTNPGTVIVDLYSVSSGFLHKYFSINLPYANFTPVGITVVGVNLFIWGEHSVVVIQRFESAQFAFSEVEYPEELSEFTIKKVVSPENDGRVGLLLESGGKNKCVVVESVDFTGSNILLNGVGDVETLQDGVVSGFTMSANGIIIYSVGGVFYWVGLSTESPIAKELVTLGSVDYKSGYIAWNGVSAVAVKYESESVLSASADKFLIYNNQIEW